jgi:CBS domain-containing protein
MLARDVMSRDVVTVGLGDTLLEAIKLMINANVTGLPVLDEDAALAGMLSEFDLIGHVVGSDAVASSQFRSQLHNDGVLDPAYTRALSKPVKCIMTAPALSAPVDADLEVVARVMLEHRVKLLPIVTGWSVVGIVSRSDLMKVLLSRPDGDAETKPLPDAVSVICDDRLRGQVATAIRLAGLAMGGGFDVVTRNGIAHLWGQVVDEASHQGCCIAAAKVPGITDVFSHMQVIPVRERRLDKRL